MSSLSKKTYTDACGNFDEIYNEIIATRQPIEIVREDFEDDRIDFLQARYHYSDR